MFLSQKRGEAQNTAEEKGQCMHVQQIWRRAGKRELGGDQPRMRSFMHVPERSSRSRGEWEAKLSIAAAPKPHDLRFLVSSLMGWDKGQGTMGESS